LRVIAGPNGAGKSTFTQGANLGVLVLDPDTIAAETSPNAMNSVSYAGRRMRERIAECVSSGQSFALETTLAGRTILRTMMKCKTSGMSITLHYVGVESPALAKWRISERVRHGGHGVPEADINRRFARSLGNVWRALDIVDFAYHYDNSTRDRSRLVAKKEPPGGLVVFETGIAWLERRLSGIDGPRFS
jgi:predicted ABC-type ATPase